MSVWTHVNAHFRFDLFKLKDYDYNNVSEIEKFIGKPLSYMDLGSKRKAPNNKQSLNSLPCGSEGSLRHHVYLDTTNSRTYVNIAFYGDLRDYDSSESIVTYFTDFLNTSEATIYLESGFLTISTYDDELYIAKEKDCENKRFYFEKQ